MNTTNQLKSKAIVVFAIVIGMFSCKNEGNEHHEDHVMNESHEHAEMMDTSVTNAVSVIYATAGNTASGVITFSKAAEGVNVSVEMKGLTPGKHGFHIHEFGDCSAADGTSAGGHFNPDGHDHAGQDAPVRHAGDLGNIDADASGNAKFEFLDKQIRLNRPNSIVGHSIIIHEKEDDMKTQPTGNAGPRVACGVIGMTKG